MKKIIYLITLAVTVLYSCETEIYPELKDAEEVLVVDAWLTQKMERQQIYISRSQAYFDDEFPTNISGAIVTVEDLTSGEIYEFEEGASSYYWDPTDEPFGVIGHEYRLTVTVHEETFEAFSRLGRVPPVDSILFKYNEEDFLIKEDYFTAEFLADDPAGVGDTYWIKTWKNGEFLSKPGELNMAYDASFTAGSSVDGQAFVIPIRKDFINPYDEIADKDGEFHPPYKIGDSVYVEIHAIDPAAFEFLFGVYFYINRPGGFAEIFSTPLANPLTNLKNIDENSNTHIAGFFNVASVSSAGQKLTPEIAEQARQNSSNP